MPSRVLETVLTGTNRLSPVLRDAARDVAAYNSAVEGANSRAATSADTSAARQQAASQKVVAANRKASESAVASATESARRSGGDAGGAFSDAFQKQVTRGLASLPDVAIGADASDADREISSIRGRLLELSGKTIGVDIDAGAALAELQQLRVRLAELGSSSPDIRVQVDAGAAEAALAKVSTEVDRLDGRTANVTVNVDDRGSFGRASTGMRTLTSAALVMSPAITSIGAVATAGLGAIGPLAASGAAGLGVLALGFSGVSDAVKLLGQRQEQVALDAAKAASSQTASTEAVASAEASLANTRANAADAAVRSAESVSRARSAEVSAGRDAAAAVASAQQSLTDARTKGARDVRRAVEDVAKAERSAAADIKSALGRQEQAEDSLSDAQRDRQRAQEDLTRAVVDAREEYEDFQLSLRGGALAEREAVLDLAEARQKLAEVDPFDGMARERAVLNLEKVALRLDEVRERNGDLAAEQAEWARTGVAGSDRVRSAQERLVDAQGKVSDATEAAGAAAAAVDQARTDGIRKVQDAQRNADEARTSAARQVSDAQAAVTKAQTDGAERVAAAQQAVSDAVRDQASQQRQASFSVEQAQRAVEKAMRSTGDTGEASLARIDAQLAEVNPATLLFAGYVTDRLKPAFEGLQQTAAAGLLPGVQAGLEHLMPFLPQIDDFVGRIGVSAGEMAERAGAALTNPFWTDFFGMIDRTAVPSMEILFGSLGNVAHGFAGIVMAFEPMSMKVGAGIEDLTGRFADWGERLGDSEGFRRFTDYVEENWPKVRDIVGSVADMVGDLVEAGLPIGSAFLTGFQLLTEVLSGLPVGVVQALLTAFIGYKAVSGVASIINGVAWSFDAISTAAGRVGLGQLAGIRDGVGGIGSASGGAAGGVGRFSGAASGLMGVLGGPWGLALGGAGIALGVLTAAMAAQEEATRKWTEVLKGGGDAASRLRTDAEESLNAGFWERTWNDLNGTNDAYREAIDNSGEYWKSLSPLEQSQAKVAEWQRTLNERMEKYGPTAEVTRIAQERLAFHTGEVARQQGVLDEATGRASTAISTQGTVFENMVGAAGEQLGIYSQLLQDKATKDAESAAATAASTGSATTSMADHVANADISLQEYAAALDADVAKKDAWREDIKRVTERGGVEVGAALLAMGEEGARIADEMANSTDEDFRRLADSMVAHARNGGAAAAWELDQAMKIMTLASREGGKLTAQAISQELGIGVRDAARIAGDYGVVIADGVNPVLAALGRGKVNTTALRNPGAFAPGSGFNTGGGLAEGGVVPGPYIGPKADNVLIRANPREFMQPVAAVEHYGVDFMEAVRQRRIPKEAIAGYADGGLIQLGREFQRRGATVSRHSAFDGRTPTSGHGRTSLHYTDDAIDVNTRPGTSALEQRELAPLMALARARGFRTIFMSAGHFNHGHVDNGRGGSIGGGSIGAAVPEAIRLPGPPSTAPFQAPISTAADAVMQHLHEQAQAWVDANTAVLDPPSEHSGYSGGGVERWRGTALQALSRVRQPQTHVGSTLRRMNQESGGNPRAINNWDINAKRGTPSKGLMQVIDPTFAANRDRGLPDDIWDPLANITASMNYALKRYGSLPAAYNRKGGYDDGGLANGMGYLPKFTVEPERVLSPQQTVAFERWMDSPAAMPGYGMASSGGRGGGTTVVINSPITFAGPVYGGDAMRRIAEDVVDRRDAQAEIDLRRWQ